MIRGLIRRLRDPWKGWEEMGWLSDDGLALGELDDAPLCQETSAAGRSREPITWPPDPAPFDSSKVTFSADLTFDGVDPIAVEAIYGTVVGNAKEVAARKDAAIREAWRKASEAGHGVLVVGQPFQVYASPYIAEGTLLYAPRLIDGVAHPKEDQ